MEPMMRITLFQIATPATGGIATMARPRGGDWLADELAAIADTGMSTLVSLLTAEEAAELELVREAELAGTAGLAFRSFPISDFSVPPLNGQTVIFIRQLAEELRSGHHLVIHCRMGIGRSSLIAASVLTVLGVSPSDAFARITVARGRPVPDTDQQRRWVERFAATYEQLEDMP
jgi:protein-tyrosine phosphatase